MSRVMASTRRDARVFWETGEDAPGASRGEAVSKKRKGPRPDPAELGLPRVGVDSHAHLDMPPAQANPAPRNAPVATAPAPRPAPAPAPTAPAPAAPAATAGGGMVLTFQVGSFAHVENAKELMERLKTKGYTTRLDQGRLNNRPYFMPKTGAKPLVQKTLCRKPVL